MKAVENMQKIGVTEVGAKERVRWGLLKGAAERFYFVNILPVNSHPYIKD